MLINFYLEDEDGTSKIIVDTKDINSSDIKEELIKIANRNFGEGELSWQMFDCDKWELAPFAAYNFEDNQEYIYAYPVQKIYQISPISWDDTDEIVDATIKAVNSLPNELRIKILKSINADF